MFLLACVCGGDFAYASEATYVFNIPAGELRRELVMFALQAHVSISTNNVGSCAGWGNSLVGRFSPRAGLERILAGAGCTVRQIDRHAYDVVSLPRADRPKALAPRSRPQENPQSDLSTLVVVATRRATPADRLAYSISAVSRRTLSDQGVVDTTSLSTLIPSMTVTNLGMGRDKILLRGLSDGPLTGQTQSLVGVYLDDVRLTFNAPDPDLRLTDIDQVEVLRGPQGALYGAGSLGGVVHVVTAPPDRNRFSASVAASVGATAGGALSDAFDGVMNLPLLNGRSAVRLVFYREAEGGYINDPQLGLYNVNRNLREGGRVATVLDLSPSWTVKLGGLIQNINSADTQYTDAAEPAYSRDNHVREPHDNDFSEFHLGVHGSLGWGEANVSIAEISHNLDSRYDAASNAPLPIPRGAAAFDEADRIGSFVSEATVAATDRRSVQWLLGIFYAHSTETRGTTLSLLGPSSIIESQSARRDGLDEGALFGELSYPLGRRFSLTTGGRVFSYADAVSSATSAMGYATPAAYSGRASQVGFAPKVVLSYHPTQRVTAYIQAAEGYRGGGLNTADTPIETFSPIGGSEPLRRYRGDELWSLEAGGTFGLLDNRLRVRVAAFQAYWTGVQSDQLLPSGLPYTANIGNGRNSGLELEADFHTGGLKLHGSVLANHPELARANAGFATLAGSSLGAAPDYTGDLDVRYGWSLPGGYDVELDGRVNYVGASQLTLDTATTRTMGDYVTGRLAASLGRRHWRLQFSLDNPLNARGDTFAYGNPFTVRTTQQVTPLRPLTARLSVHVSY